MTQYIKLATFAMAIMVLMPSNIASAQDGGAQDSGESPWLIRVRALALIPDESSIITVIGGDVAAQSVFTPELDITYFFTKNIAMELVLTTTNHNITAVGTALGDVDLGDVWLLPPVLTAQYHFDPDGQISPYVGARFNLTLFYGVDAPGGVVTDVDYQDKISFALQAGADYKLEDNWSLNLDTKKVWLNTNVALNGGAIAADVDLDPWILSVGVGYRF